MATLVVHTQGTLVGARSRHLHLSPPGGKDLDLPLTTVDRLHLYGRCQVTTGALGLLARSGKDVAWFTRRGRLVARLANDPHHGVALRRAQYRLADDPAASLDLARRIVATKILNQRAVLLRAWRQRQVAADDPTLAALELASIKALEAADADLLRGLEGAAAARYFTAWAALLPQFPWTGRNRRPPRDPLNILLSLGYTLLTNECQSQAEAAGLDPWLGVLHGLRPGRAALALDLVEALRPVVVDRLILDLVTHGRIATDHFTTLPDSEPEDDPDEPGATPDDLPGNAPPADGLPPGTSLPRLTTDGFRKFLAAYERRMAHRAPDHDLADGLRPALESQIRDLCRNLRDGTPGAWTPYRLRT